jgi:hypothetical protein
MQQPCSYRALRRSAQGHTELLLKLLLLLLLLLTCCMMEEAEIRGSLCAGPYVARAVPAQCTSI